MEEGELMRLLISSGLQGIELTIRKFFIVLDVFIMYQLAHYLRWIPDIRYSYPSAPASFISG
jgi:hypothetical protein